MRGYLPLRRCQAHPPERRPPDLRPDARFPHGRRTAVPRVYCGFASLYQQNNCSLFQCSINRGKREEGASLLYEVVASHTMYIIKFDSFIIIHSSIYSFHIQHLILIYLHLAYSHNCQSFLLMVIEIFFLMYI